MPSTIHDLEAPLADEFSDIAGFDKEEEKYLINLFGAQSSRGVPYHSFILDPPVWT